MIRTDYYCDILADSYVVHEEPDLGGIEVGYRLTTFEITFPRIVLSEFNTHRMFARNSASSRAIPVEKLLKVVQEAPYVPSEWPINGRGMQGHGLLDERDGDKARSAWLRARDRAVEQAEALLDIGVHKGITNRLLEPFLWHTVIVTATDWSNFFHLRNHDAAHPAIREIARRMELAYDAHGPGRRLQPGEWHLPLVKEGEALPHVEEESHSLPLLPEDVAGEGMPDWTKYDRLAAAIKVCVGRCARVSYLTHDGRRDPKEDVRLHDQLLAAGHLSPFEHAAYAMHDCERQEHKRYIYRTNSVLSTRAPLPGAWEQLLERVTYYEGPFNSWRQYRKTIRGEEDVLGVKGGAH